jgi:NAD(P)-dependent dehydrogenase (short-subunit alcohol dehydrogenase family)
VDSHPGELRFEGRVAIVTGAGRGVGRAYAQLLAERGAGVVVNDVGGDMSGDGKDADLAQTVADEIANAGGTAIADSGDVATVDGASALVESALSRFGRIDIVINNAGILIRRDISQETLPNVARHLAVHVLGSFNVCRAAWPHLAAQGYGRIVNTTSTAIFGVADLIAYGAAKGGVLGLSRALAIAGRGCGISVNVVSPMAQTRMAGPGVTDDRPPELVASVVAFLAHEECTTSGEIYLAGGGRAARIFIGETQGYAKAGLTPEDVRANWAKINAEDAFHAPADAAAHNDAFLDFLKTVPTATP